MELQSRLEKIRDVKKFIDYLEAYFQLTPSDELKGTRKLHEDFKKQTYITVEKFSSGFIMHVYLRAQQ